MEFCRWEPKFDSPSMTLQDGITSGMLLAALAALLSVYCANRSFHVARYGKFS